MDIMEPPKPHLSLIPDYTGTTQVNPRFCFAPQTYTHTETHTERHTGTIGHTLPDRVPVHSPIVGSSTKYFSNLLYKDTSHCPQELVYKNKIHTHKTKNLLSIFINNARKNSQLM